ncbi:MAG: manganese and iron superoxide dismutase [Bacteroidetes bacterium]|jgi:Fe-Mn family superoxide dismutase|nr:manganese and iron superoxide dismutase [Bacteroidota bacterium]
MRLREFFRRMTNMKRTMKRRTFVRTVAASGALALLPPVLRSETEKTITSNQKEYTQMAFEWKFNPRPYSDEEAKKLLAPVVDAETTDWHYNTHHKGYVTALNNIEKALETADRSGANGNYSQIGELKRRTTWNHGGTLLHDIYWDVLGGDGDPNKGPEVKAAIEKEFGSFDAWKADFKATAISAKLSGWGVLTFDQLYSHRLLNVLVDEHHYGAIWGGIPLIPVDVFEHAYYHKDGPKRALYIDNFIANLHWGRINARYKKYAK